jgi:hypothetical protein
MYADTVLCSTASFPKMRFIYGFCLWIDLKIGGAAFTPVRFICRKICYCFCNLSLVWVDLLKRTQNQIDLCRFSMLFTHLASKMIHPFNDPALYHPPWKPHAFTVKNKCFRKTMKKVHPKHAKLYVCHHPAIMAIHVENFMWRHWSDINYVVRATPEWLPEVHEGLSNLAESYNVHDVSARV